MRIKCIIISLLLTAIVFFKAECEWRSILQALYLGGYESIDNFTAADGVEKEFLSAVFTTDGETAKEKFFKIWRSYKPHPLAWEALERVRQYHYALGDYPESERLAGILKDRPLDTIYNPPGPSEETGGFFIQAGAFSIEDNARKQREKIQAWGYSVKVIPKKFGNKQLFIVRIGSYPTKAEALAAGRDLEKRLNAKVRLVEE
ncbi:SPOR domain-containing protein [bacterium]|nr:SPOR domain-containing protein [FCB group bacterium]MBL7190976.1 SPOR domain-containing protein [bacterium]